MRGKKKRDTDRQTDKLKQRHTDWMIGRQPLRRQTDRQTRDWEKWTQRIAG
jgi:hypothetical protein